MSRTNKALLGQVSIAHLVSHLHIMSIPALLPLLPKLMNISFTKVGFAIGLFNVVSALVQAPLGFMVDRLGAQRMLLYALATGAISFALLAFWPNFYMLLLAMLLAGIANGVYHPADYALLSRGVAAAQMGKAFSIHTFAGFVGAALAPPVLLYLTQAVSLRAAFAFSALAGVLGWLVMRSARQLVLAAPTDKSISQGQTRNAPAKVLVMFTLLFMFLSLSTGSIEKFSVSALVKGFAIPLSIANNGLTAFLLVSAFGVLAGGYLADRSRRHGLIAALAFAFAALVMLLIIQLSLTSWVLVGALALVGFFTGLVAPSRDMLVRAAAPAGSEGKVFGIVSTGYNAGGVVGPLLLGYMLDKHMAGNVLWATVIFMLITSVLVLYQELKTKRSQLSPRLR